jgi:DtxR family Mn-dependent transcriptional regulator
MSDDLREFRTKAIDDFLKAVYTLQRQMEHPDTDPVPTNLLAQTLKISAPSVTDMIKRLASIEDEADKKSRREDENFHKLPTPLLEYTPYHGARLTPEGEKIALEVIRHHRLIELYLVQKLGYTWDEVHEEAERLEHHISEKLEARIAAALGDPEIDPHGDPIPTLEGTLPVRELPVLADLPIDDHGTVRQITDQTPEVLRYLSELGLTPGAQFTLVQRSPLGDTVSIRVGDEIYTISTQVARTVLVTED